MTQTNPGVNLLLKGEVGSQAFGLANANSDRDYLGIFVEPTISFHGLKTNIQETFVYKNPDTTYHEVGKYCRLGLKCNPTILDLLWLEHYNVRTELGTELVNLRFNMLSSKYVRDAYLGYAQSQLGKLLKDERPAKRSKNARHFARLLRQGWELYSSGTYSVRLADPEWYVNFGIQVGMHENTGLAYDLLNTMEMAFDSTTSVLPEKPNEEPINEWLLKVRHGLYKYPN
jgi:predicted nucleotidyltransferase